MDPRQIRHVQGQPRDNRFSWQVAADANSNVERAGRAQLNLGELTPQQIAAERVRLQEAQRAQQESQRRREETGVPPSIESTPIEFRAPAPWGAQRRPTEPTIPQSPTSPADPPDAPTTLMAPWGAQRRPTEPAMSQSPISPEDPPGAPTTLMAPHSFARQLPSHQATSASPPSANTPPVSYAVLPQGPNAPLPAQSSPPPIRTDTLSSPVEKPKALSPDSAIHLTPPHAVKPYIPYADTVNSASSTTKSGGVPYSPGLPSKSSPYAPDDLVHVHQAAALQQGRATALPPDALAADTRAHQPGQIAHPNQRGSTSGRDAWSHSLFACAPDADTCCLGLVCPCVLHGRTTYRLGRRGGKGDPTDMLGFESCNAACGVMAALACVGCVFPMLARARVRHAYKIEGGVGGDCVAAWCCCCCVAVQNEREVKEREESRRRYAGPGGGEGYVPPSVEMRYQPGGS